MIDTAGAGAQTRGAPTPAGGLTAAAAVVLILGVTLVTAVLSAATGRGFGIAFNLVYLLVTLYAALRIYVEDRFVAVVAPPLIYATSVFIAGFFDSIENTHAVRRVLENTFVNMSFGAPSVSYTHLTLPTKRIV